MDFELVDAVVSDAPRLAALNRVVQDLHVAARPDVFSPALEADVAAWFAEALARPKTAAWIAVARGVDLGYVVAFDEGRPANPFAPERRWVELDQLAVRQDARGRGVAKALIARTLEWARERGVPSVELNVWNFNENARAAFAACGFSVARLRCERSSAAPPGTIAGPSAAQTGPIPRS